MPSPFPGMDPYLEARWRDVHARLILYSSDAIQDQLPGELRAWVEERVVLETPEGIAEGMYPDVRVIECGPRLPDQHQAIALDIDAGQPLIVDAEPESLTEGFIHIIDPSSDNAVVTVVEILSPTNKLAGPGRETYLRKQEELRCSRTNLVEIDLVRQGAHVVAVPLSRLPRARRTPYLACVRRATNSRKAEVYSMPIQLPLPTLNIPLRPEDADVKLDLQAMITQTYRRGRYEGIFDYTRDPEPRLTGADAAWADQLLREKGLRTSAGAPRATKRRKPPAAENDHA